MNQVNDCPLCQSLRFKALFEKHSRLGKTYTVCKCKQCGLTYVNPRPSASELAQCYTLDYFSHRDDRGYNDYLSDKQGAEVLRVMELNLADLGFTAWEQDLLLRLDRKPRLLDIGTASGVGMSFFSQRQWHCEGVEISPEIANLGIQKYGQNIHIGDFLQVNLDFGQYDLITLWATIEHLRQPKKILQRASQLLAPHGRLYITTCRHSLWGYSQLFGQRWRFFNVPEHLVYFSARHLTKLAADCGLRRWRYLTYGSGISGRLKKMADLSAKKFYLGDMMALAFVHEKL